MTLLALALLVAPLAARAQDADGDGALDGSDNCPGAWNRGQDDRDADGVGDVCDDCRFAANPGQQDTGGFGSSLADGIGDACQCGDVSANARVDIVDVAVLGRHLASLPTGTVSLPKCPAAEPGAPCNASARLALRNALAQALPPTQVCAAAICSATPCGGGACAPNAIALENRKPGVDPAVWDIPGGNDDAALLGYATDMSYAPGQTLQLKVNAEPPPPQYSVTIYRIGWYGGKGARQIASFVQNAPVDQPACQSVVDPVDCSNWSVTDTWPIPPGQISGVYVAKLLPIPQNGSNGSHVLFVIRDDVGGSDLLFQTADVTWLAYNPYPTQSIFGGTPTSLYNGARRVRYDRPLRRSVAEYVRTFFGSEYHLVRFLERNGYDVSYFAGVDTARRGAEIAEHRLFLAVGHDEYWSREMRDAVDAARDGGTSLAFLSGNLMFWKTRWEDDFRTLVGYKSSTFGHPDDPGGFTASWRDVRYQDEGDPAEPENSTTGLIFGSNGVSIGEVRVPQADGQLRLWRGTRAQSAGACEVTELAPQTIGIEWDHDQDNGHRPPGLFRLSSSNVDDAEQLVGPGTGAAGGLFASIAQANHHVTEYRHATSGALVLNAGTIDWTHGLDRNHMVQPYTNNAGNLDMTMMQAMANFMADVGAQGATPIDYCPATASSDATPPSSQILSPAPGAVVRLGSSVEITGSANDTGGRVAAVELSLDGGATWQRTEGRDSWHYRWRPLAVDDYTLLSRAVDDSGNLQPAPNARAVAVGCPSPCSIWPPSTTPVIAHQPSVPVELGIRFRPDDAGSVRAIRFYANAANTGPHAVHLWTDAGALLGTATAAASAVTGWREAVFAAPVPVSGGEMYVASYFTSTGYSATQHALDSGWYRQPLGALASGGVYTYGAAGPLFPVATFENSSYWVDVDFVPAGTTPRTVFSDAVPASPNHFDAAASLDPNGVEVGLRFRSAVDGVVRAIRFYRADDSLPQIVNLWLVLDVPTPLAPVADDAGTPQTGFILESGKVFAGTGTGWTTVPLARPVAIEANTTYVASYHTRERFALDAGYFTAPVANAPLVAELGVYRYGESAFPESATTPSHNYWVDVEFSPSAPGEHRLWSEATVPPTPHFADPTEVEVGVRFTPEVSGFVDGVRFYKHPSNGGAHTGTLWSGAGAELRTGTFTAETSCGWQELRFATPVAVTAGATYMASYHSTTGYAGTRDYFGAWSPPLRAVDAGLGIGAYRYGAHAFPDQAFQRSIYYVDVIFRSSATPAAQGPVAVPAYALP
jgi:hypothetical protein